MRTRRATSIRQKLTAMIMFTTTCAVVLASFGYLLVDLSAIAAHQARTMTMLANVIGDNATASILFGDARSANEVLQALRAKPSIVAASIHLGDGREFTRYAANASAVFPRRMLPDGFHGDTALRELYYGIRLNGERIGTLYMAADGRERDARVRQYAVIATVIVLVSLLLAFVVSAWLQTGISGPIVELARVASVVSREKNFSVRIKRPARNESREIVRLMTGFNGMLAEIEQRDDSLLLHQTQLEAIVETRTGELTTANAELSAAKSAAERAAEVNARLARKSALILNSATDGIIVVNREKQATFLNPAANRMLGTSAADLNGKSVHDLIHHTRDDGTPWPEAECTVSSTVAGGQALAVETSSFWRTDGSSFPVEYSATPLLGEHGAPVGAVLMFRDVTERREVERLKKEFVSTVSHELRTPLTSIRGALGLLSSGLMGSVGVKAERMLEIAVTNTDRLVRLINDILDLERMDSARVQFARVAVDADELIVHAIEGVQQIADASGVRLIALPAPGTLWCDSDRIIQTLTNLVGNAIKFSPRDTTVTVNGAVSGEDFLFCVADEGRGIPADKLRTIFERFSQVDTSDSRDKGGSGLGLAICERIVAAHGGRIWAENNVTAGTRVFFTIPRAPSPLQGDPR